MEYIKKLVQRCSNSGPFWMVIAGLSFGFMGVFVKLGSNDFSTAELVFYRCAAGLLFIAAVVLTQGKSLKVDPPILKLHLSRSVSGFVALMLYFYAISQLPLATAVTLNYTSPLFFALIMTLHLKQSFSWRQLFCIALGFVGVVLLLKPTISAEQWLPGLLGLCSGFLASIAYLNVSELGKSGEPEWRTVFYFSLVSTIGAAFTMLLQASALHVPNWRSGAILLGMSIFATIAQLAMTRAYRKGRSLVVVSLAYLTVLFSTLLGGLMWGDRISLSAALAMFLIVFAGIGAGTARSQRT